MDCKSPHRARNAQLLLVQAAPSKPDEQGQNEVETGYKRKAVEYWRSGRRKNIKLDNVLQRFTRMKHKSDIYRWAAQVDARGTRMAKLMKIDEITGNMFRTARNNRFIVHDDHIRRFAVQANVDAELEGFKASKTWLNSFKKSYRIVSS